MNKVNPEEPLDSPERARIVAELLGIEIFLHRNHYFYEGKHNDAILFNILDPAIWTQCLDWLLDNNEDVNFYKINDLYCLDYGYADSPVYEGKTFAEAVSRAVTE